MVLLAGNGNCRRLTVEAEPVSGWAPAAHHDEVARRSNEWTFMAIRSDSTATPLTADSFDCGAPEGAVCCQMAVSPSRGVSLPLFIAAVERRTSLLGLPRFHRFGWGVFCRKPRGVRRVR